MQIESLLAQEAAHAVHSLFGKSIDAESIQIQPTRKEFDGEFTIVVFPLAKHIGQSPPALAEALGNHLKTANSLVSDFSVVQGFLNLQIKAEIWTAFVAKAMESTNYGFETPGSRGLVLVEYSSPNTNKPLHLGHLRNNFLGFAVAEILKATGHSVMKVQIINDRGIHICKSMVAWKRFGNDETPESTGIKGDHLVGKYYVAFDKAYKVEIQEAMAAGKSKEAAEAEVPIMADARETLLKWEAGEPDTYALWEKMNSWVYAGFEATYKRMGVDFDKLYYESNTWVLGKDVALEGRAKGIFNQREDGSIWADLSAEGMDEKLLLRRDGTAVYMTQDLGTAILRYQDFPSMSKMVYTVGNEQEYHFKVLFALLQKLGYNWANDCHHLSYGMVELPQGKMKSREGTVVDADDLMQAMVDSAKSITESLGKLESLGNEERSALYEHIGMAALKYFLLKVDPRKGMMFNPEESIDFNGHTGPFIQYGYARTCALGRKYAQEVAVSDQGILPEGQERKLLQKLYQYPKTLHEAAFIYNPAILANYLYDLAKDFNTFYQQVPVLSVDDEHQKVFRMQLVALTGRVIKSGMGLLGIAVPEQM
jgi:arginyl-tRNA synthetase